MCEHQLKHVQNIHERGGFAVNSTYFLENDTTKTMADEYNWSSSLLSHISCITLFRSQGFGRGILE